MSQETQDQGGPGMGEDVLLAADPDLNVFALANGMDLHRNRGTRPDRVLEWYRDGLERFIHVVPAAGNALDLAVGVEGKVDGVRRVARVPFRSSVAPGELRSLLVEAIDAANALGRDGMELP